MSNASFVVNLMTVGTPSTAVVGALSRTDGGLSCTTMRAEPRGGVECAIVAVLEIRGGRRAPFPIVKQHFVDEVFADGGSRDRRGNYESGSAARMKCRIPYRDYALEGCTELGLNPAPCDFWGRS